MSSNYSKCFMALFLIISISISGYAQNNWRRKLSDKVFENYSNKQNLDLLLILKDKADLSAAKSIHNKKDKTRFVFEQLNSTAQKSQANIINLLNLRHIYYQSFYAVNAIRIKCNAESLPEIADLDQVKLVINNGALTFHKPVEMYQDNLRGPNSIEWGIDMINANDVWALGYRGQGVVVGGEDTGYQWDHPAIITNYRGWDGTNVDHNYNWHDAIHELNIANGDTTQNICGLNLLAPCDDYGHGTHTMGTMVGFTPGDTIGVAPAAKWIGVRNMETGDGKPSTYIEAFEWFIAPTDLNNQNPNPDKSPDVINNSWGCPPSEGCDITNFYIMNEVVKNVKAAGIVVVVSAGNSGSGCSSVDDPAAMFEESFSVGAMKANDTIANFSSRGPVAIDSSFRRKPNVSAPGVGVRSCIPGNNYAYFSGTSMAGPHVVGAVALILSAEPVLAGEVDMIEDILESTAVPKTSDQDCGSIPGNVVPNNTYGYGRIDALAAVNKAFVVTGTGNHVEKAIVKIFPNPVSDLLYLDCNGFTGNVKVEIMDITGKLISSFNDNLQGRKILKSQLPAEMHGMFIYKVSSKDLEFTGKFVKL